ncbi:glycerate kinase [Propioniciclava sinopodophylli]|uniref:Glycerate kinase n=1 Tax=Propioniciclava sinopodophylli TaxID=1837344 RepID=A0A4Q9KC22_9ACTN|nr:glycerate kinase [Propioniciclava sinopodophylli]TBT83711.1 glycerate kinase [Propioniciclava sinopodophylli]
MRIVCAPDSFKHSLTAAEAAAAMARGVRAVWPDAEAVEVPLSDGGEGFTDAIADALGARVVDVPVQDARGRPATGRLALAGDVAAFEMASASGLEAIADDDRDILASDTRGVGQLVRAALDAGATTLVIGLGGSATNDGGAGMLAELGVRFLDAGGRVLATTPAGLADLASVDATGLDPRLVDARVRVACDVDNPLLGERGASAVFGPQKGATTPELVTRLDATLARLAELSGHAAVADAPGAGAAGGLGFALLAFAGAELVPGIELVCDTVGFHDTVAGADLVLSGEGSIDAQTLSGKTPAGVADVAGAQGVPVVLFGGRVAPDADALRADGRVAAIVGITPDGQSLPQALANAAANLERAVADHLANRPRRTASGEPAEWPQA